MKIKQRQIFTIIGILILSIIVTYGCKEKSEEKLKQKPNNEKILKPISTKYEKVGLEYKLSNYAKNMNQHTPIQIDKHSILDSVTTKKGKAYLVFHHTLIGKNISDVNYDSLHKYIRSIIIEDIEDPEFKIFNENKISIDYRYYGENGRLITELAVTNKPKPDKKHD